MIYLDKLNSNIKYKILSYIYAPIFCQLEDCNKVNCHNCFPVLSCNIHTNCIDNGQCVEYLDYLISNNKKIDN